MRQIYALLLGLLMVGCVQSQALPCGDILCPSGAVCTETGQCAFTADIAACTGKADGDTCEARGGSLGVCSAGACSVGQCGNGAVDGGEACDDGNRVGADGCAADCSKMELCGDAIADDGEACDDGNRNAVDGCDACKLTQWSAAPVVGGPLKAVSAGLSAPEGVAVDVHGNIYIADTKNHRIAKVDSTGGIATVAGTGTQGSSGDGGAATSATLFGPRGIAVDGVGNLYIADTFNNRIRRVDVTGVITTVAGTGTQGASGDGSAAKSATLSSPFGVAVDGLGDLYIADTYNNRIRRVNSAGTIDTVVGTGAYGDDGDGGAATSAQLERPVGVAVDGVGNLYIADSENRSIRKVDSAGVITTIANANNAQLLSPSAVAVDVDGSVYFANSFSDQVGRISASGVITNVAGTGTQGDSGDGGAATSAQLADPRGVVLDGVGNLYIADASNNRIRRVDRLGIITTIAGIGTVGDIGDGGDATAAQLSYPSGVGFDGMGDIYIADSVNRRIRRVDAAGTITTVAGVGEGAYSGDGGVATMARLVYPTSVAFDRQGNLYVSDIYDNRIRRIDDAGIITTVAGTGAKGYSGDLGAATNAKLGYPISVAVDSAGNLYIADNDNHRIRRVDTAGVMSTVAGTGVQGNTGDGGSAVDAQLAHPAAVAVDDVGNLYIADSYNHRIRRVDTAGFISTIAGTGISGNGGDGGAAANAQCSYPNGVAVDRWSNVYISDATQRIRRIDASGIMTTIAGTGSGGNTGDGGAARDAKLSPGPVTVDGIGNLYFANGIDRVRRVNASGVISTVAGTRQLGGIAVATRVDNLTGLVSGPSATVFLVAGVKGIVARMQRARIDQIVGRYPHTAATGNLARFRDRNFGSVGGVAWDESAQLLYLTESSPTSSRVWAVTPVNPDNSDTWTISALVNDSGRAGFADGASTTAKLRNPTGLWLDAGTRTLYIADSGNHAIRALNLTTKTVTTVVNSKHSLGFAGDGAAATAALLYQPQALTKCANGDLFIADTGNNRIRRVAAGTGLISTVVGDGVPASSGQGAPATIFPVDNPLGVACDAGNNLFVTSSATVRLLPASPAGIVDGSGEVQTIYGATPRNAFPASETSCLTGIIAPTATTLQIADSCSGLVVELTRSVAQ